MTQETNRRDWESYEQIATFVLNQCAQQFGLSRFEGKQNITGNSGTDWEVDARGWVEGGTTHFLVECKNHKDTAISQAITGSLAYQILDTNAKGGFLVSPNGLQTGAKKVAIANNITEIKLSPLSTKSAYFGEWLGNLRAGFTDEINSVITDSLIIKEIDEEGYEKTIYDSAAKKSKKQDL